jgi:myo-inositol-1(or 4)-monophosphatase
METKLMRIAQLAAQDAGKRLLKLFHGGRLRVAKKYDYPGSIVTNADHEAERLILARIRRSRVKCSVDCEESGKLDFGSRDLVWAIDPLDGTLNYAKRIPYFAVSIGVLRTRKTMLGVIYNPILDEMYTAIRGQGAQLNGKRIRVSNARSLANSSLIFDWWEPEPSIPDPLDLARRIYRHTRTLRSPGSVALNLCAIASGRFDGMITVYPKTPVFETAAGSLIAAEAGAKVTNSLNGSWEDFSRSLIAGGVDVHSKLMQLIWSGK